MITAKQKELIQATVPILREHGVALTTHFYNRMFTHNPELKNVFNMGNQKNGKQQMALAMAVLAYAEHIENPSVLGHAVGRIGYKHTSLDIRPEHYAIVGKHLLASISEVLGEGATPELIEAWAVAYGQLADIMIGVESGFYKDSVAQDGGWTGWRPFILKEKVQESGEITSFYLYPADGGKVAPFLPGQYISVRLFLPELHLFQPRQYSLSAAPNERFYRISVKREAGSQHPDGMISNRLHDHVAVGDVVELAPPFGGFTLDAAKETPVVFISGGIGQTPLLSMLESLVERGSKRKITWIHGSRNKEVHAFKEHVHAMTSEHGGVQKHYFYDSLEAAEEHEYEGIVELERLSDEALLPDADYYVCGPSAFIKKQYKDLVAKGVRPEAIHYEEFGPSILSLD
ncbi:NO-inducible flavohemoprotein [Paraflavisolibacter sp. H34]|uniref:NO-inducible flavohemoprotein n=1 Tax=Huijunlia imazamoxiresistens TaxID=3127457 RepID=UPI0030179B4D